MSTGTELVTKEDKIKKLIEIGIVDKKALEVLKTLTNLQLDYLIEQNEHKVPKAETKEEAVADKVEKAKWESEVVKRRKSESDLAVLKRDLKYTVERLNSLIK